MFSPALGRAARTTCAKSSTSAISFRAGPALATANHLFSRPHQRRNSSTSCPPDNSRGAGSAPANTSSTASKPSEKKAGSRSRSKKGAQLVNPPAVPPTSYLKHTDVALSSLFSCHRPISVTTSIPIASSEASFNSIFDAPSKSRPGKYNEVMYTLGNTVRNLDAHVHPSEEVDVRAEIAHHQASGNGSVIHLDSAAPQNLNQFLAQLRPYSIPPPPEPVTDPSPATVNTEASTELQTPKKRVWKTSVIITESTDTNGKTTFAASSSPVIRMPVRNSPLKAPASVGRPAIQQPFLERMEIREQEWRRSVERRMDEGSQAPAMHAISVKRQRKLKMKKHKYKKLMKRTRNLRRRLGQT